jgi:cysteine desulfurase family protein (TIGR01976 family)
MSAVATIAQEVVRSQFPALQSGFVFFENAGGSQMPQCVIDAMTEYMQDSYVQTGVPYPASVRATKTFEAAHKFADVFVNADDVGECCFGPSTSVLISHLANAIRPTIKPGDQIIVSVANHEANINPWVRLEEVGAEIIFWDVDSETGESDLDELQGLLNERTRVVAIPHTSNLLGDTMPVKEIASMAHAVGAKSVVDGVAYASHAAIDVSDWGVDFYVYSTYKVYGPHMAVMFGRTDAWSDLVGPNHYFNQGGNASKFELGCQSYEGAAGILALQDYLALMAGDCGFDRNSVVKAFKLAKSMEIPVMEEILGFLNSRSDVRLIGSGGIDEDRHPTISFVHESKHSQEISDRVCEKGIGIRWGHVYSARLCEAMNIPAEMGVIRASGVHYNTVDEARRLTAALEAAMDA